MSQPTGTVPQPPGTWAPPAWPSPAEASDPPPPPAPKRKNNWWIAAAVGMGAFVVGAAVVGSSAEEPASAAPARSLTTTTSAASSGSPSLAQCMAMMENQGDETDALTAESSRLTARIRAGNIDRTAMRAHISDSRQLIAQGRRINAQCRHYAPGASTSYGVSLDDLEDAVDDTENSFNRL